MSGRNIDDDGQDSGRNIDDDGSDSGQILIEIRSNEMRASVCKTIVMLHIPAANKYYGIPWECEAHRWSDMT